jgi:hypothetical protein
MFYLYPILLHLLILFPSEVILNTHFLFSIIHFMLRFIYPIIFHNLSSSTPNIFIIPLQQKVYDNDLT